MTHRRCSLLAVAALCLAGSAPAQEEPPPAPSFPDLPAAAEAGTGMIQPCLEELEGRVRCGRYRVYEDRARRLLSSVLSEIVDDRDDPDLEAFTLIASETDHLPIGSERDRWSRAALAEKQPKIAEAERWAKGVGLEACRNVAARFGSGRDPSRRPVRS